MGEGLMFLQAGLTGASAISQAGAERAQGKYQQRAYDANARMAELQAQDATQRGQEDVNRLRRSTKQLVGAQRAIYAAQGQDLGSGSALDVQRDTAALSEQDAMQIRLNAAREAFGYRSQGLAQSYAGKMARRASSSAYRSTLLTGGLAVTRDVAWGLGKPQKGAKISSGMGGGMAIPNGGLIGSEI